MRLPTLILPIAILTALLPAPFSAAAEKATPLALLVETEALGSGNTGTVMGIVLAIAPEDVERAGEHVRVVTTLLDNDTMIDRQSAVVRVESDGSIMLFRDWPLGSHQLKLAVSTLDGLIGGLWVGQILVPERENPFDAPEDAEVEAVALSVTPTAGGAVRFLPPPDHGGIGALQLQVETPDEAASVEFFKDEASLYRRNRPPWTVSIALGEVVRRTQIRAIARDRHGRYLGEDALVLNNPTGQIGIQILLAPEDAVEDGKRQVTVAVSESIGRIHQVTLSLDSRTVARWARCPCITAIPVTDLDGAAILAAEAVDSKGNRGDTVFPLGGGGGFSGMVRVELVELPITVMDENGTPVLGLGPDDFSVLEDGHGVTVEGFGTIRDLPLSLALAVDTSGSMVEDFPAVLRAVDARG
ncbi:MAG: hypothetical protein K8R59_13790 [Thermoanaerobaculales bacterium]|nr:hypothetical protein [Thermoanaerobaculales bacterium]